MGGGGGERHQRNWAELGFSLAPSLTSPLPATCVMCACVCNVLCAHGWRWGGSGGGGGEEG